MAFICGALGIETLCLASKSIFGSFGRSCDRSVRVLIMLFITRKQAMSQSARRLTCSLSYASLVVIIQPAQHASSDQSLRHKSLAADADLACRLVMITSVDKTRTDKKKRRKRKSARRSCKRRIRFSWLLIRGPRNNKNKTTVCDVLAVCVVLLR
jgi:hypothetical protein